jgi:hypothetical protein
VPQELPSTFKTGVFSPAHSIKGSPSPKPKPIPSPIKEEYQSVLYRVTSKTGNTKVVTIYSPLADVTKTLIHRDMVTPTTLLGAVASTLHTQDWIEVYYRVQQPCWLVEGLKYTISVHIIFREISKILIFDDGITVTDAIEVNKQY